MDKDVTVTRNLVCLRKDGHIKIAENGEVLRYALEGEQMPSLPFDAVLLSDFIETLPNENPIDVFRLKIGEEIIQNDMRNHRNDIYSGASANAPITTDSTGASQSATSLRFDLIPAIEIAEIAKVLGEGEVKYPSRDGVPNWHGITTNDHLNHAIQHIYAYMSGDRSDNHLAHAATRLMFAMFTSKRDRLKNQK